MDLIVRSPAEIRRRLAMGDSFLREMTTKGIVLHEADDARVGRARTRTNEAEISDRAAAAPRSFRRF